MKKFLFVCLMATFVLYSCFFPEITLEASKKGLMLWFQQILPALLPFTILSSLLLNSHFFESFSKNANLFAILFTMVGGFLFGFPIGAKLSSDFYEKHLLTEKQAILLAITTNNFSPMYICGFALPLLFTPEELTKHYFVFLTYILNFFLPLILGTIILIFQAGKHKKLQAYDLEKEKSPGTFELAMSTFDTSIINGFQSLIKICGYILIFSILCNIFMFSFQFQHPISIWLLENLEINNGIALLSASSMDTASRYILGIQLLSFGGLSGLAQTASMISPSGLSVYKYIIGKVLLSLLISFLAAFYVL